MDGREKRLFHQIHPVKLATDFVAAVAALFLAWEHRPVLAVLVGLGPPALISTAMLRLSPDLEWLKASAAGRYLKRSMTPAIVSLRLLSLVPMAYGAWNHAPGWIVVGALILAAAWANGLIWRRPPE